jgi:serine phosphatase RsbU (regulator of sigma subunit)
MLDVQIAVAKTNKYASRESGDTVEVVERPHGGFSVVLADGQGSGRSAKSISHLVTTKAISLIKDGARDGAAARSVHDYLYTYRGGKVSATLVILSVDLSTHTLVLSRNSHCPILLSKPDADLMVLEDPSTPIGIYAKTKPVVTELPLQAHTYAVTYSDGLMEAGGRAGTPIDLPSLVTECLAPELRKAQEPVSASKMADYLLERALDLDASRPTDDMTALVLAILPCPSIDIKGIAPQVRRMELHIPI